MKNIQAMAGGSVGYVRGVFSARCRGVAIPAELLRVHLRGVARVGVRRRLAAEFAGYLVTEQGPAVFSRRRWWHKKLHGLGVSGCGGRDSSFAGWVSEIDRGAIDAPEKIAAGAAVPMCKLKGGLILSCDLLAARGAA